MLKGHVSYLVTVINSLLPGLPDVVKSLLTSVEYFASVIYLLLR